MKVEQIYTGCLAQVAYYIESNGEVAIIDPLREVQDYIDKANNANASIKYIFETHFHADFVSGHVTLAEKTGATIVYGVNAKTKFKAHIATQNEVFKLGNITITALHTPGHTLESTTYLLKDEQGKDYAIFSGDTLFLGDVGRPDLAQKGTLTQEGLAEMLYDSLRTKIMPLADEVIVYPGHGAGSACGKNLSKETVGTVGEQKKANYALRSDMTKAEFVKELTQGLMAPPAYFPLNVQLNKEGYQSIDKVVEKGLKPLSIDEFDKLSLQKDVLILDVRHQFEFVKGFVPNSMFIGLNGTFAPWVGALVKNVAQKIILVTPKGEEHTTIKRLSRVGFDNVLGYLDGSFETWKTSKKPIDTLQSITVQELETVIAEEKPVFDSRKPGEYNSEHIIGVPNTPLDSLFSHIEEFPKNEDFYIHCAGGYRSVIASSMLKMRGYHNVIDVAGGYRAIKETNIKRVSGVCPSTLK